MVRHALRLLNACRALILGEHVFRDFAPFA
jgi:hypothetical protein